MKALYIVGIAFFALVYGGICVRAWNEGRCERGEIRDCSYTVTVTHYVD